MLLFMFVLFFIVLVLYMFCLSFDFTVYYTYITFKDDVLDLHFMFSYCNFLVILVVFLVSFFIYIYIDYYMNYDLNLIFFLKILFSFVFSMFFFLMMPSTLGCIFGWDGLGLTSYLLVVYYNNVKSLNSGLFTIMMNRLGDFFILLSLGLSLFSGVFFLLVICV